MRPNVSKWIKLMFTEYFTSFKTIQLSKLNFWNKVALKWTYIKMLK